jgi:hypothetical protein
MLPIVGLAELNRLRTPAPTSSASVAPTVTNVFFISPLSSDYRPARAEPAPT